MGSPVYVAILTYITPFKCLCLFKDCDFVNNNKKSELLLLDLIVNFKNISV